MNTPRPHMDLSPEHQPPGAQRRDRLPRRFLRDQIAWLVLAASLLVTGLSWQLSRSYVQQRAQDRFNYEVQQAEAAILRRMQEYEQVLRSGVGLFTSSDDVTRQDWHRFVSNLDLQTYWPGLQGLGYAVMLTPQQRASLVQQVRREGFPAFDVRPEGERSLYSSIIFLEPFSPSNQRAFGYDMYSEPTRRQAMELARDSGRPAVSGPVILVQESGKNVQTGFLMYMPHYRNDLPLDTPEQRRAALQGFVYSPYRTSDLMQGILGQDEQLFNYRIYDGEDTIDTALLHSSEPWPRTHEEPHRFSTTRQLQLPGRTWTVQFASSPSLDRELVSNQPLIVGTGGLLVDLLLFLVIRSLSLSRQRTAAWAREQGQLLTQLQLSASVFEHAREGIFITDPQGHILDINPMFETLTGYPRREVIGQKPSLLKSGRQDAAFYRDMWQALLTIGHWEGEIWNRRKNGELFAEALNISAVRAPDGQIRQFIGLFSDITALKQHQSQLERMAHFDALTGLPNRVLLGDRLQQAMVQTQRRSVKLAVVYLDLDGFKGVNDDLGHEAGDRFLIQTAERMKATLREGDTLARLGGDEFVAVLLDLPDIAACVPLVMRLLAAASQEVHAHGVSRRVSASLGVTFFPQNEAVDADQLLRQADQAMYQAKLAGKNRYHIFDMDQDRAVRGHHESLERIRQALEQSELVLYYQPKVNMRTGQVVGAEALIRWQHPVRGLLPPDVFLPVIEDHPLSLAVGNWVLSTALAQWQQWQQAGWNLQISVNISAMQIQQPDFAQTLRQHLSQLPGFPAHALELEVLETSALQDMQQAARVIEQCQSLGVSIALDDFGTGYSSLTYLKRLQAQTLKVDRSFVRDMLDDLDDLAILEGVLGLARAFDRVAVAEGVESVAHGELLLDLGCELAQGYGIARPMPAADLPDWLTRWQPPTSWLHRPEREPRTLPLLFAMVEHRNWVQAVEDHLLGQGHPPPMGCTDCKFGHWLTHDGRAQFGQRPVYAELHTLHETIHQHARHLLTLQAQGQPEEARAGLDELKRLRDALLQILQTLT